MASVNLLVFGLLRPMNTQYTSNDKLQPYRDMVTEAVVDAYKSESPTLIEALPGMGKSTAAIIATS